MKNLTEDNSSFQTPIAVPQDAVDVRSAASLEPAFQKLANRTAYLLQQFAALNASNLTAGTVPLSRISGLTDAEVSTSAAIAWSKISKTGSSLADLGTRSASDLNSGTLDDARLPSTVEKVSNKGVANGYAGLGSDGKILASQLNAPVSVYPNLAGLAIPAPANDTLHLVEGEGLYQFDASSAAVADGTFIVDPSSGAGQFVMRYRDVSKRLKDPIAPRFEFVGDLSYCVGVDDVLYIEAGFTITSILVYARKTPASGTITLDVLGASGPGGTLASLYSATPPPSLTCNGGGVAATFTGANLPDSATVAAGSILAVRITGAPAFADDLLVVVR